MQARLTSAKSLQEFADYVNASGLRHNAKPATQQAENLQLEMLDRFVAMSAGPSMLLPQSGGTRN